MTFILAEVQKLLLYMYENCDQVCQNGRGHKPTVSCIACGIGAHLECYPVDIKGWSYTCTICTKLVKCLKGIPLDLYMKGSQKYKSQGKVTCLCLGVNLDADSQLLCWTVAKELWIC